LRHCHDSASSVLKFDELIDLVKDATEQTGVLFLRHSIRDKFTKDMSIEAQDNMPINEDGITFAKECAEKLQQLPKIDFVLSSPAPRCVQTAKLLVPDVYPQVHKEVPVHPPRTSAQGQRWQEFKAERGWLKTLEAWLTGKIPGMTAPSETANNVLSFIAASVPNGKLSLVCSHDMSVLAVAERLNVRKEDKLDVSFLGGIFIPESVLNKYLD
jgi:broad specificity phosphatase PhoE